MKTINNIKKCKEVRIWLRKTISAHFGPNAGWLQCHVAKCPRCQRRLVSYAKVHLAISTIKSQPHKLDLLMCANAQTIGVLKHKLREAPKAEKLRKILPEPGLLEKCRKYTHSSSNVAACIMVLLLMKIGVFSSMDTFRSKGQRTMKKYYAGHVGQDLADEIFPQDNNGSIAVT
ncbi:MAG: hypothetical protein PVJ60_06660 [Phycisphaerales bacterium]|jgi:hypothetical protein